MTVKNIHRINDYTLTLLKIKNTHALNSIDDKPAILRQIKQ